MLRQFLRPLIAGGSVFALCATATYGIVAVETFVLTGNQAAGLPSGIRYTLLSNPLIDALGRIGFSSLVQGFGVTSANDSGLWFGSESDLTLIAREGDAPPGISDPGVKYNFLERFSAIAPTGQVAFQATLTGPSVAGDNDVGIWAGMPGSVTVVAREGDTPPGISGDVTYDEPNPPLINSSGTVAYTAAVFGGGVNLDNDSGFWAGPPTAPALIVREGSPAPGAGVGVTYGDTTLLPLRSSINASGRIAFITELRGTNLTDQNDTAIYVGQPGAFTLRVREGNVAAGSPSTTRYSDFFTVALNATGDMVFSAALLGENGVALGEGIWMNPNNTATIRLVAKTGDKAPGTPAGVNYDLVTSPVMNNSGVIAFSGSVSGPGVDQTNNFVIFAGAVGSVQLIGREATTFPEGFGLSGELALNDLGQVAFVGIDADANRSLWTFIPDQGMSLIAQAGTLFDVDDGPGTDLREIEEIGFRTGSAAEDGLGTGLSANGDIAFELTFTNNTSGIFVAHLIPEPSTAVLLLAGLGMVGMRRQRRP